MARIRSIHPGLFTDEAFMSLTMAARVLLVGILTEADDQGIFEVKPVTLKAKIFPADSVDLPKLLLELDSQKLIARFDEGTKKLAAIRNFMKWQRPKKPVFVHELPHDLREFVGAPSEEEDTETNFRRAKWEEQGGRCFYCKIKITYYSKKSDSLELDHRVPKSEGGTDDPENIAAACRTCNRSKGKMSETEFRKKISDAKVTFAPPKQSPNSQRKEEGGRLEEEDVSSLRSVARARENEIERKPPTRLPDNWKPLEVGYQYAKALGLTDAEIVKEAERFRNHARQADRTCSDWGAAWQNWALKALELLGRKLPSADPPKVNGCHVKADTPQWTAWTKYRGKPPPRDGGNGWIFPSEWPPGMEVLAHG